MARRSGRAGAAGALALTALALLLAAAPSAQAACPNESLREIQHSTYLPDCRAYELVSPPDKNGTGIAADSQRTRAAADGSAVGFISLGVFGGALGTGIATDYLAERSHSAEPGDNGWATHATTPPQSGTTYENLTGGYEPLYQGEFSAELERGVFFAQSPLTADPNVANVTNLYLRTDLRSPGAGSYRLITSCPRCEERGPLPPPGNANEASAMRPFLAWTSPDEGRVVFESGQRLTSDTPAALNRVEAYEWAGGAVHLLGRVPSSGTECDDSGGSPCTATSFSLAGQGASHGIRTPHVLSDGSDGHVRAFFTFPTREDGTTLDTTAYGGKLYLREDGHRTVQINASERTSPDTARPAFFWDASANGERAFFTTRQALTDGAPVDASSKLYMYDATKPASAPDNLTLLNVDNAPGDGTFSDGDGMVGASDDGRYAYFVANGQIVDGEPLLGTDAGLYLWHDGVVRYVGPAGTPSGYGELLSTGEDWVYVRRQARVAPDGRHLLYSLAQGGARQLYLFSADGSAPPVCVSCHPGGAPSSLDATDVVRTYTGATNTSWHENRALVEGPDGHQRVFFSTPEPLLPEDTNGTVEDVYEYDATTEALRLISSGTGEEDSWFMDASADGSDVFFVTSQRLLGWDTDSSYDLYDARVGGGFPEPTTHSSACASAETCKQALGAVPSPSTVGSTIEGPGNPKARGPRCPKGKRARKSHGRTVCVKRSHRKRHHKRRAGR